MPHYLASYPRTAPTTGVTRIGPPAPIAHRPSLARTPRTNKTAWHAIERPRDDAGLPACRPWPRPSHRATRPSGMAAIQPQFRAVINLANVT